MTSAEKGISLSIGVFLLREALELNFLKVVRMVFWSGVVGPGFRSLARSLARASRSALVRSRFALTVALRAQKFDSGRIKVGR